MKAFLLAAGAGTRLRPLTDSVPKCLVPIRQQPLLDIWLQLCRQHGIDQVLVNLHAHAGAVREFLSLSSSRGIAVTLFEEPVLLGSAGTIAANRAWVESEPFFILYADVLTNVDLQRMLTFHHRSQYAATLGLYEVSNPTECGIVSLDRNNVVRGFVEKPQQPESNLAFSGVMIATPAILDLIPAAPPADVGFHVLPQLVGKMVGYHIREYLVDIGTMSKYEAAQGDWPGISKDRR